MLCVEGTRTLSFSPGKIFLGRSIIELRSCEEEGKKGNGLVVRDPRGRFVFVCFAYCDSPFCTVAASSEVLLGTTTIVLVLLQ